MNRVRSIFAAFTLLLLSCNFIGNAFNLTPTPMPTPTDSEPFSYSDCSGSQPTQAEIDRTRQYNAEYFPSPDWTSNYTVMADWVVVTWDNEKLVAMATFSYAIVCGVKGTSLDKYYTDQTFDMMFDYYDGYDIRNVCEANDLRLYEVKVWAKGFDFNARLWVEVLDSDHLMESQLLFPVSDVASLDDYSEKIMPSLPSCE